MSCKKYFDLLEDFAAGEPLDEQIVERLNQHVFACTLCGARFDSLKRERELYARYLFAAEPPPDLWAKFQTRLAAEPENARSNVQTSVTAPSRKIDLIGFLRWRPVLTGVVAALVLLSLGYNLSTFVWKNAAPENQSSTKTDLTDAAPETQKTNVIGKDETANSASPTAGASRDLVAKDFKNKFADRRKTVVVGEASGTGKAIKIKETISPQKENRTIIVRPSDLEHRQQLEIETLAAETARQIEKVELLLRSFRNARSDDGDGDVQQFDVAYEKRQARKLLETNVRLRRDAENYGSRDAAELLSRVEPYLLDIANLETAAPDKVQDIKERVKNQNIIASLQIY